MVGWLKATKSSHTQVKLHCSDSDLAFVQAWDPLGVLSISSSLCSGQVVHDHCHKQTAEREPVAAAIGESG